ncbi:ExbD/TolR family protein [Colwelliaceae bacterium BS250]
MSTMHHNSSNHQKHSRDDNAKVDMTPMLDIIFIMLIFFIVTTSFVKESGIDASRTLSSATPSTAGNVIALTIDQQGYIYVNNRLVDIERVTANIEVLLAENPSSKVVLNADPQITHQQVVTVMDKVKNVPGMNIAIISK